jgi:starch phosphorylase
MPGTLFRLELRPQIPAALSRLTDLASNLMYSWDRDIRGVFWRLDKDLWRTCGNNPKLFLRRVSQRVLEAAADDDDFLQDYNGALSSYDSYLASDPKPEVLEHLQPGRDLIAYFCAEFGLHESLPIYSGGLGILAGDHCKAASDLGLPFVAVGLLYREGYFIQTIDALGRQVAHPQTANFDELPISIARDAKGAEVRVSVPIADRTVQLRVWRADVGHIALYLLDSDLPENSDADRSITFQLYGGNTDTRIQQEIVLGVGGVRALRALGLAPTAWHINEGHAAFLILERVREQVAKGMDFDAALEEVAAGTVFTTHTPVPAGHDIFHHAQLQWFFQQLLPQFGIEPLRLLQLGADGHGETRFNMTALALRGSRYHNGVSRIHGGVASAMERKLWPQITPEENPIGSVTNGVHLPTFIARAWTQLFHDALRGWRNKLLDVDYWQRLDEIPNHRFRAVRRQLKRDLLIDIDERITRQHRRNEVPEALIAQATQHIRTHETRTLVLGFARRFATYKRATLILRDPARLSKLLNDPQRPAILIFAGKAHPKDQPGQDLIRQLHEMSLTPEFIGRLFMVEGYDMLLARNLVQGCDVWLNNPEYPQEASGTSGEKAGINGVVNVSVMDGWWAEGYQPEPNQNGYAIVPVLDPNIRDAEESRQLLDLLEHEVAARYYHGAGDGYSDEWLRLSRNSMKSLIPRFNSSRQVIDYVRGYYGPASKAAKRLSADQGKAAQVLSQWKRRVREAWPGVSLSLATTPAAVVATGERLPLRVQAQLNGLDAEDLVVECRVGRLDTQARFQVERVLPLKAGKDGVFETELEPLAGLQHYQIRAYPRHPAQAHRFELGAMVWL